MEGKNKTARLSLIVPGNSVDGIKPLRVESDAPEILSGFITFYMMATHDGGQLSAKSALDKLRGAFYVARSCGLCTADRIQ